MDEQDQLISVLPIHFSNAFTPDLHIHQYPLLTRPLQTPPSAIARGKRITARIKPKSRRLEVQVPVDTRPEVWNSEKGGNLGAARLEDDKEKNQDTSNKGKTREGEMPPLSEVRMRSEPVEQKGIHMLGVVRNGQLHLHPISESHQLRPTLTYLDYLSKKSKQRSSHNDSDSDDGPPLDPDDPTPLISAAAKKDKKAVTGETKDIQVSARKAEDKGGLQPQGGGLSTVRREMLALIRNEEDDNWQELEFCDGESEQSATAFEAIFSQRSDTLLCTTEPTAFLKDIKGL